MVSVTGQAVWIMCCGDVGRQLAQLYQEDGNQAIGWVRTDRELQLGYEAGIHLRQGKLDASCYIPFYIRENVQMFWFAPPPARGQEDIRLRRFLTAAGHALQRLVLWSRWDGESLSTNRDHRYADAERVAQAWMRGQVGRELVIVRSGLLAGRDSSSIASLCKQAMDSGAVGIASLKQAAT
jgi:hypothetical protein